MIKSHDDLKDCLKAEKAKYKNIHMLWLIFPVAEQDFSGYCVTLNIIKTQVGILWLRYLTYGINAYP